MYDPRSPLLRTPAPQDGPPSAQAKARFAQTRLLDAVVWCEVAPGEVVTEADVMTRFGLTRAAARAGLTQLGYGGWAAAQPRTGWLVLPITGALIGQVLDARRIAEPALALVTLDAQSRAELLQIESVLASLNGRTETAARSARDQHTSRLDTLLLDALDPFTARHLRHLWRHTARITRFLENAALDRFFAPPDMTALIAALLAEDGPAIRAARLALIDAQRAFFLEQLLNSDAPLTPGSGGSRTPSQAAINRRET